MCGMNRYKMATPQEKAQFVFWFIETKSDVQTQRKYRTKGGKDPPHVLQFVNGTRTLWSEDQYWMQ